MAQLGLFSEVLKVPLPQDSQIWSAVGVPAFRTCVPAGQTVNATHSLPVRYVSSEHVGGGKQLAFVHSVLGPRPPQPARGVMRPTTRAMK
jgi:hypothetical protein